MIDIQNDSDFMFFSRIAPDAIGEGAAELLKEAATESEFDDLVKEAFADPENRQFPIYSPEMAVMSAIYMQHQNVDPLVKEACERALQQWGFGDIACDRIEKTASYEELPAEVFLLQQDRKFPVVDEATLEKSASAIKSNLHRLDLPEKVEACTNLYKRAVYEYGVDPVDLGAEVNQYAQEAPCSITKLAMAVNERKAETGDADYDIFLQKLAMFAQDNQTNYIFDKSLNSGIAVELYGLDKVAGVTDKFDAIKDVFNSPFYINEDGEMEKTATLASVVIGDYLIPEDALEKVASSEVAEAFPGLEDVIFEDGAINPDALVDTVGELLPESKNAIGEFLSTYVD